MYEEKGDDGKRKYTGAEIAETFGVSRKTRLPVPRTIRWPPPIRQDDPAVTRAMSIYRHPS